MVDFDRSNNSQSIHSIVKHTIVDDDNQLSYSKQDILMSRKSRDLFHRVNFDRQMNVEHHNMHLYTNIFTKKTNYLSNIRVKFVDLPLQRMNLNRWDCFLIRKSQTINEDQMFIICLIRVENFDTIGCWWWIIVENIDQTMNPIDFYRSKLKTCRWPNLNKIFIWMNFRLSANKLV